MRLYLRFAEQYNKAKTQLPKITGIRTASGLNKAAVTEKTAVRIRITAASVLNSLFLKIPMLSPYTPSL